MKNSIVPFLIFLIYFSIIVNSKKCGHAFLQNSKDHKPLILEKGDKNRYLTNNTYENIRIHFDFSLIRDSNQQDKESLKDRIMPETKQALEKLIKVKRLTSNLKFEANYCDNIKIPETYSDSGDGVQADIIIFVILDTSGYFYENDIEAAAIHCLQDSKTKRPLAGYIQFRPNIDASNQTKIDYLAWLALHEITHILVMNEGLYPSFINPDTNDLLGTDKVIKKTKHPISNNDMYVIISPKVLEAAKNHFNCQSIEGIPLEYNGGSGTAGAHWSKITMNTDYMIGDSYGENLVSKITLALFSDSGWYNTDPDHANIFQWGQGQGCSFFEKKCVSEKEKVPRTSSLRKAKTSNSANKNYPLLESSFPKEFCTIPNEDVCSRHNIFRGHCTVREFKNNLPEYESYFKSNLKLGGIDSLTNKCPISIEKKNGQSYYGGSCRNGVKVKSWEKICPDCACFMSTLTKESDELNYSAGCNEFKCIDETVVVVFEGKDYKCVDGKTKVLGYKGEILCPDYSTICSSTYKCKFGCPK